MLPPAVALIGHTVFINRYGGNPSVIGKQVRINDNPATIIGVMPGHALLGSQFTATSMIGMIALAGIIVRNSILLVDFTNTLRKRGVERDEAIRQAQAVDLLQKGLQTLRRRPAPGGRASARSAGSARRA